MSNSTINERFQSIIDTCFRGNKRAFATQIGVSATVIENVVGKRNGKPSFDVLRSVCANANISAEWLLTGEGSMLKGGEAETEAAPQEDSHIIDMLQAQLAEKDKQIATLLNIISKMQ